jgi:hypothetical protein
VLHRPLRGRTDRERGDGVRLPRSVRGTCGLSARFVALFALAVAACAGPRAGPRGGAAPPAGHEHPETSPSPPHPWEGGTSITSADGAWRVVYRLSGDAIPRGKPFTIDAWVFAADAPELPRTDVELTMDAAMPEHGHGMNRVPRIERRRDGRFHAEGMLFHMPGKWELYFDVTRGPVTERAQIDVQLE